MNDELPNETQENRHDGRERELKHEISEIRAEERKLERELEVDENRGKKLERELSDMRHSHARHLSLVFIINGEEFPVEASAEQELKIAVEKALAVSGNTGRRELSEWEVRDSAGVLLDMLRTIHELGLQDGARLFLSLRVGAGGQYASGF